MPERMPAGIRFIFSENAGMAPAYTSIELALGFSRYETQDNQKHKTLREFQVGEPDLAGLYALARRLDFAGIRNKEARRVTYDAGSEGVTIVFGNSTVHVASGSNFPFRSYGEQARYAELKSAIFDLASVGAVSEGKSEEAKSLLRELAALDLFALSAEDGRGYVVFAKLRELLGLDEWQLLVEHSSPIVELYAFWAVLKAKDAELLRFLDFLSPVRSPVAVLRDGEKEELRANLVLIEILDREDRSFLNDYQTDRAADLVKKIKEMR